MMEYTIKSHPTMYAEVMFRSRLEATWAAFFDICGYEWNYEPFDLEGWTPDFEVTLVKICPECKSGSNDKVPHKLLCEVKPYSDFSQFNDHPITKMMQANMQKYKIVAHKLSHIEFPDIEWEYVDVYTEYTLMPLGINPGVTSGSLLHNWKGTFSIESIDFGNDWQSAWKRAQNITRWKGPK